MATTTKDPAKRFAQPKKLTDIEVAFCTDTSDMMPAYSEIPSEFRSFNNGNPYVALQKRWFFKGVRADELRAKPGIDRDTAVRHLKAIQGSWEPKHEHKVAGVAFLMSLWLEEPTTT